MTSLRESLKRKVRCQLRIVSSITLKDRHYYLPLPFINVVLPNNYDMAEQQALNIVRKFKKDEGYAAEYKGFMEEVITKRLRREGTSERMARYGTYHTMAFTVSTKEQYE